MEKVTLTTLNGEVLTLHKENDRLWYCSICGSLELRCQPRTKEGASFEMCSCGFEFGFDDEPAACLNAIEGINNNWARWREMLFYKYRLQPDQVKQLQSQLEKINYGGQF